MGNYRDDKSLTCLEVLCSGCDMIGSAYDYDDDGFDDGDSDSEVPLTGTKPIPKWDQFR